MKHIKTFESFLNEDAKDAMIKDSMSKAEVATDPAVAKLYKKYQLADEQWQIIKPGWRTIKLDVLLKTTRLTMDELEELDEYADNYWLIKIDKKGNEVDERIFVGDPIH